MIKVFLVEASPTLRSNLAHALEELAPVKVVGYAEDEPGAVNWINSNTKGCDLILIDTLLRSGSGLGVLRAAATVHWGRKVVLSTGPTPELQRMCAALGADFVLDKSNALEELVKYCAQLDGHDVEAADESARKRRIVELAVAAFMADPTLTWDRAIQEAERQLKQLNGGHAPRPAQRW